MSRAALLQEIRKMRFLEVYERCRKRRLSHAEAAETLGVSERTFRRLRGRFEAEGEDGVLDRRVGKPSPRRMAPTAQSKGLNIETTLDRGLPRLLLGIPVACALKRRERIRVTLAPDPNFTGLVIPAPNEPLPEPEIIPPMRRHNPKYLLSALGIG